MDGVDGREFDGDIYQMRTSNKNKNKAECLRLPKRHSG